NLARMEPTILPPDGVYAGRCETPIGHFRAAISLGSRPTVAGAGRSLEAFLLDYPGDSIYGSAVRLEWLHRLRPEARFDSLDALVEQMHRDVAEVRRLVPE
ncbi:MAG: riboflavin kinase, partial [Fimbriimonadaceae bacterium]|nr:riboflavin kinase [Fimbriimonadaceae bacterium]